MAGTPYITARNLDQRCAAWLAQLYPSRARPKAIGALQPTRVALLVVDAQRYFSDPGSHAFLPALPLVLPNIQRLLGAFRAEGATVIFARQQTFDGLGSAMDRWWNGNGNGGRDKASLADAHYAQFSDGLQVLEGEHVLDKPSYSSFSGTELAAYLRDRGIEHVVICGAMTHLCVESTARDAFGLDYSPLVIADATASQSEALHLGALRSLAHGFGPVVSTSHMLHSLGHATANLAEDNLPSALPESTQLLVVGAGPGGLAAAIQAKRSGVDVVVVDAAHKPGLLPTANRVENYPGFPGGIAGAELMQRMQAQAAAEGIECHRGEVTQVRASETDARSRWVAELRDGRTVDAAAIIVATGTRPREMPALTHRKIAGLFDRLDRLPLIRRQRILIIGGGEAAFDQALMAKRLGAAEVHIACRGRMPRTMALLLTRAADAGVKLLTEAEFVAPYVEDGADPGESRLAHLSVAGIGVELAVDAVLVCFGRGMRVPELPQALRRDAAGLAELDRNCRTSLPGLYVIGDACRGRFRQVGIAVGDALVASMHAAQSIRQSTGKVR